MSDFPEIWGVCNFMLQHHSTKAVYYQERRGGDNTQLPRWRRLRHIFAKPLISSCLEQDWTRPGAANNYFSFAYATVQNQKESEIAACIDTV